MCVCVHLCVCACVRVRACMSVCVRVYVKKGILYPYTFSLSKHWTEDEACRIRTGKPGRHERPLPMPTDNQSGVLMFCTHAFFNRISYMNGASRLCCTKENEKLHFVSPVLHLVCFTMLVYCVHYCCMWGFQVGNLDRSLKGKTFVAVLQTEQFLRCKWISSS